MYMNESWAWRALNSLSKTTLNQSKFSSYITLVTPILLNQLWSLTIPAYGVAPSQKKTTQIPPTTTIYSFFFLNSFFTRAMLSSKLKQKNEMAFYLFFFLETRVSPYHTHTLYSRCRFSRLQPCKKNDKGWHKSRPVFFPHTAYLSYITILFCIPPVYIVSTFYRCLLLFSKKILDPNVLI